MNICLNTGRIISDDELTGKDIKKESMKSILDCLKEIQEVNDFCGQSASIKLLVMTATREVESLIFSEEMK